jgi:hypothetical protein
MRGSSPQPLALGDSEITTIMQLARPLPPRQRAAFLEMVTAKLAECDASLGEGAIYHLCRELQRELFSPPLEAEPAD